MSGELFVTVGVEFVTFTARISSQLRPDDQVALNNLLSQLLLLDPEPEEMNQRLVNAGEAGCGWESEGDESVSVLRQVVGPGHLIIREIRAALWTLDMTRHNIV